MFFSRPVSCLNIMLQGKGEAVNFWHGLKILGCSTAAKAKQGSLVREVAWAAVSRISSPVLSFWSGLKSLKYLEFGKGSQWGWVKSPIIWVTNKVPIKTFPNSKTRLIVKRKRWKNGDMLRSYERRSEIFSGILIGWGEARFLHLHVVYKTNMRWGKANLKMKTFICNLHICNLDQRMFSICMQGFSNTSWIFYIFPSLCKSNLQ